MAREFPLDTVGTYSSAYIEYDYTDNFKSLFSSSQITFNSEYPKNLFWGGISRYDVPEVYPVCGIYNFENKTISITSLDNIADSSLSAPKTNISYCYVSSNQSNTNSYFPANFYTSFNVSNTEFNPNYDYYMEITNFSNNVENGHIVSKVSLCKSVFTCNIHYIKKSELIDYTNIPSIYNTTIEEYEQWEEDGTANDYLLIGFTVSSDLGYIENNSIIMQGYNNTNNGLKVPMNALFGNYIIARPTINEIGMSFNIYIPASGGSQETYALSRISNYKYGTTLYYSLWYLTPNIISSYFSNNGEFEFNIETLLNINTKNTPYIYPYNDGDPYILFGRTTSEFYWSNVTFSGKIYPIYKSTKELLKVIMSLGMAFYGAAPQRYSHSGGEITNNLLFAPVLDENNIYRGEYTRGNDNLNNDFFEKDDSTDTTYDPDDNDSNDPEEEESGDRIPNQFNRGVGVASNFVTQYIMSAGQIAKFGEILWTSWADDTVTMDMVENFYGLLHDATGSWNVSSALQFIISCRLFPLSLPTLLSTTATTEIPIGTGSFAIKCGTLTEPTFYIANQSVAVLNCGDIFIPEKYNDFRDYDNTNITAYLPYCGTVQLNPGDVVGKWLGCVYAIDLFDGSCKAFLFLKSSNTDEWGDAYYNVAIKSGQCGFLIPLSATNAGQIASRNKVDNYLDGMYALNSLNSATGIISNFASGNVQGTISSSFGLASVGQSGNIHDAMMQGKSAIAAPSMSGGSSFADFMQPAKPYVQIRRAIYQDPLEYNNTVGYPVDAQTYGTLSDFSGLTICNNVDVSGLTCHEDERNEIKAILESGVYV